MKTIDISRWGMLFFAIATVAFGIQNWLYGDFVMGRAPGWPSSVSGQSLWANISGAVLILFGITVLLGRRQRIALISIGIIVILWALLRHILQGHWQWGTEITHMGKALVLGGGALGIAGTVTDKTFQVAFFRQGLVWIGRFSIAAFLVICGIQHFMFIDFVQQLVPVWIPERVFWTYFTGILLIAGGVGFLIPRTQKLAARLSGIMVFTWFIILHIPRAIASGGDGNEWIAVVEALAVSGIAFAFSGKRKTKIIDKTRKMQNFNKKEYS